MRAGLFGIPADCTERHRLLRAALNDPRQFEDPRFLVVPLGMSSLPASKSTILRTEETIIAKREGDIQCRLTASRGRGCGIVVGEGGL